MLVIENQESKKAAGCEGVGGDDTLKNDFGFWILN
jgi:hypothetical protein